MYTAPAVFAVLVNTIAILTMLFVFEEKYAGLVNDKVKKDGQKVYIPKYDRLALFACYLGRFTQMFIFTNVETLATPFAMTIFAWTKSQAVSYISLSHVGVSLVELVMYVGFVLFKMDRFINLRLTCIVGFIGFGLYYVGTFSWPFVDGHLKTFTEQDYNSYLSGNATEPVGCNVDHLSWCDSVKPVNIWLYFFSYVFIMGASFCLVNITLNTVFSQVIGPRRQATHQGILQMIGSCGRLVGPLVISTMYTVFGPPITWCLQILVLVATLSVWISVYKRLIPLEVPENPSQIVPKTIDDKIQIENLKSLKKLVE
ncbi:hypothetical protein M3Y97_00300100 [Aphelenchoides bicaudatus]|nr:hypothetical protein M3Y97_00300100 [Aphelenchoides bicaudatus]